MVLHPVVSQANTSLISPRCPCCACADKAAGRGCAPTLAAASDVVAGAFLGALLGLLFAARAVLRVSLVVVGTAAAGSWGACSSSAASEGTPEPSLLQSNRVHQAAGNGTRIAVV